MTHIPFLRMDIPEVRFAGGFLVALAFDRFDEMTLGAFTDARRHYEATAPVFFVEGADHGPQPLEGSARVQAALNLAVPTLGVPDPRLSLRLFVQDGKATGTTQGDADLELLFLAEAAGWPLGDADLERARLLLEVVDRAGGEQLAALGALCEAASPSLAPGEQLTLCAVTLEALLLPEITSGLRRTFGRRLANLAARDDSERERIEDLASAVYTARSETVHGQAGSGGAAAGGMAQVLLARSVIALDGVSSEEALQERRDRVDEAPVSPPAALAGVLPPLAPGLRPATRMSQPNTRLPPSSWSPDLPPAGDDEMVVFAPLPGLAADVLGEELAEAGFPLTALAPGQLLALEDRDVGRDWVAQLLVTSGDMACVALSAEHVGAPSERNASIEAVLAELAPWQDAAVSVLRLAGFTRFHDPQLLGDYALVGGSLRYRRPTVYRQTVLLRSRAEPEQLTDAHTGDVVALWALVLRSLAAPSPVVDHVLALFRRAHDTITLTPAVRMQLLFAGLEAVVGRAPRRPAPHPVAVLAGLAPPADPEPFDWHSEHGTAVRNAVAHGYWDPAGSGPRGGEALPLLTRLLAQAIPSFLLAWARSGDERGPGAALVDALAGTGADLDWRAASGARADPELEEQLDRARAVRYTKLEAITLLEAGRQAVEDGDVDLARRRLRRAAAAGLVLAMNDLGIMERSAGDVDEARRWYAMAIAAGDGQAVYNLGILEGAAGNDAEARRLYEQAARAGEPKAMNNLGFLEESAGNLAAARDWYEQAAEGGSVRAFDNLAILASQAGDTDGARSWWEQGAAAGDARSARCLGQLDMQAGDVDGARTWLQTGADLGDGPSMFWLGVLANDDGDTAEADDWWTDAADHGVAEAHHQLGVRAYDAGDRAEARRRWTVAAEADDVESAYLLGILDDQEGRGTTWLQAAAAAGHERAIETLAARGDRP